MEYYQDLITQKSFEILQNLKRKYDFILIGGWAVFLYNQALKSKDIDIIIEYDELEKIKKDFDLNKNERLKRYEIKTDELDIDLYLPFYSNLGLPAEEIKNYLNNLEGFFVPKPEILLILKQTAYLSRLASPKGNKDKIDIIGLLNLDLDFKFYKNILKKYNLEDYLEELRILLKDTDQVLELNLNKFKYSKLKKKILKQLNS
ncbi:MAG: hypothetical protein A2V72_02285 [Candidatus Nealsonbacteria bacterium RBG_13_37_56]|uniref:DUF6036 domain-containing protein n=1 Tax=Candidatus Nealsonbacteria bacterium RBG_13_37_56 TaxID=1801661 RepID=A0A1G2DV79_9BACT|nr:MAG: hypothetical protein A2V72_02285 [Candidatus Nealsonbacteria bacterium RBG_13_37_56]